MHCFRVFKLFIVPLVLCLSVTAGFAQAPVITEKSNLIFHLDPITGTYNLTVSDVATVTGNTAPPTINPNILSCDTLGKRTVRVRAVKETALESYTVDKYITIKVTTTPVFQPYADVTIASFCPTPLPDYTVNAKVSDFCTNPLINLKVTQMPAPGTPIPFDTPTIVTLHADDGLGGTADVNFMYRTVPGPPVSPSITITADAAVICAGTAVTYTATTQNKGANPVYQWKVNGVDALVNTPAFTTASLTAGNNIITCTITNTDACANKAPVMSNMVTTLVNPVIVSALTISPDAVFPVCKGSVITFTASLSTNAKKYRYQWQVNGLPAGTNSRFFSSSTLEDNDAVTCTIAIDDACSTPVTSNTITIQTDPPLAIMFYGDVIIKKGEMIQLNPVITGNAVSYSWSPAAGVSNTNIANPYFSPQASTRYQLTVTSAAGCMAVASVSVLTEVFVPNTFTPNGDGVNDLWQIPALSVYPNCTVDIYNRSGYLVYESKNGYTKPWDGTFNNGQLPSGSYYYVIDPKQSTAKIAGYVIIVR